MSEDFGRYRIERELGRGAMGLVYEAFDTVLERLVAIKTISSSLRDDSLRERFIREARAAGKLHHPHIITIYDFGVQGSQLYISMELVEGTDLFDLISQKPQLDICKRLEIVRQICLGLDFAHAHGVFHRDVKPANIRLDNNQQVKIVDFGLAVIQTSSLTQSNAILGTPSYIAPERLMGQSSDAASDQFAVGIILFELLTYQKAFIGDNISLVIHNILHSEPPPLDEGLIRDYPRLNDILRRSVNKNPRLRFPSLGEMARELEGVIQQMTADDFRHSGVVLAGEAQPYTELLSGRDGKKTSRVLSAQGGRFLRIMAIMALVSLAAWAGWFFWPQKTETIAPGVLIFDVKPYARVLSIQEMESSRPVDLPPPSECLTPFRLFLPAGGYRIVYDHPDWQGVTRTLNITLEPGGTHALTEPVDERFVEEAAGKYTLSLELISQED